MTLTERFPGTLSCVGQVLLALAGTTSLLLASVVFAGSGSEAVRVKITTSPSAADVLHGESPALRYVGRTPLTWFVSDRQAGLQVGRPGYLTRHLSLGDVLVPGMETLHVALERAPVFMPASGSSQGEQARESIRHLLPLAEQVHNLVFGRDGQRLAAPITVQERGARRVMLVPLVVPFKLPSKLPTSALKAGIGGQLGVDSWSRLLRDVPAAADIHAVIIEARVDRPRLARHPGGPRADRLASICVPGYKKPPATSCVRRDGETCEQGWEDQVQHDSCAITRTEFTAGVTPPDVVTREAGSWRVAVVISPSPDYSTNRWQGPAPDVVAMRIWGTGGLPAFDWGDTSILRMVRPKQ